MKKAVLLTSCMLLSSLSLAADIGGIRLGDELAAAQARIAELLPEATATPVKVRFTIPLGEHGVRSTGEFETWVYTHRVSSARTVSWAISVSPDTGKVWMISHGNHGHAEGRIPLAQFSESLAKFGNVSDSIQRLNAGTHSLYSQTWAKNARGGDLLPPNDQCAKHFDKMNLAGMAGRFYVPTDINPRCVAAYGTSAGGSEGTVLNYDVWASDPIAFQQWYDRLALEKKAELEAEAARAAKPAF